MFSIAKKTTIGFILCSILFSSLSFGAAKDDDDRILKEEGYFTEKRNPDLFNFLNPLKDQDKIKSTEIDKRVLYAFVEFHEHEEENFWYHDRKGVLGYIFILKDESGDVIWRKLIWVNWSAK
jgi:hypothetical protein